ITNFNKDGLAVVQERSPWKRYIIIDKEGNRKPVYFDGKVIEIEIDYSNDNYNFYDRSFFSLSENKIYVFRNKNDNNNHYFKYDSDKKCFNNITFTGFAFTPFSSGIALARDKFYNVYFINKKFKRINVSRYFYRNKVFGGATILGGCWLKVKDKSGNDNYFNIKNGKLMFNNIPVKFDINNVMSNGYIVGEYKNLQEGVFDSSGNQITDFVYEEMGNMNNGMLCVKSMDSEGNTHFRYINKFGVPKIFFE
ncbi:MAG: hypothetical protein KDC67_15515, partial [Ignavibacteriae bacterium]|nr:hypothetical protein [Ignavibacteriota bacterium]